MDNDIHIISGINISRKFINPKGKKNQIIRAEDTPHVAGSRVKVVGGDSSDIETTPPTIIIEKDGDRIVKIIVKCPCGRHSELLCEYDEGTAPEPEEGSAPGN